MRTFAKRWLSLTVALFVGVGIGSNNAPKAATAKQPARQATFVAVNPNTVAPEVCEHQGAIVSAFADAYDEIHVRCHSGIIVLVSP